MAKNKSTNPRRAPGLWKTNDQNMAWVLEKYPQLAEWRELAVAWMAGETRGIGTRLRSLAVFFERYLIAQGLPLDPTVLLQRSTTTPDYYQIACPTSQTGIEYNNLVRAFLDFVLKERCSEPDDFGAPVVLPAFGNPIPLLSFCGLPKRDEAKPSPLPYGYIDELRQMLAQGPHFRDWIWAQTALGASIGHGGYSAPDWFRASEDQINHNDPDCVWRVRQIRRTSYRLKQVLEMWCPVRWVALLIKLILPLRTFQVRMLDSGEADTWRYEGGLWVSNPNRLARGSVARPVEQGVFRRAEALLDGKDLPSVLHINTNKTADIDKSGSEMGYDMPWYDGSELHQNAFYWLEKLRNWQEKYNPITRRIAWTDLDGRHIPPKSAVQLAAYSDTCFLFRNRARSQAERHLPLTANSLDRSWFELLASLEQRLARRGETKRNGEPIRFLSPLESRKPNSDTTLFPLHSLRVSLITALALEGKVPFSILQKLVGHSRLLMTLYYFKPGATSINAELLAAKERINAMKHESIERFLSDTEHDELLRKAICNDVGTLIAAIPEHPAARNPVGWMPMHHGLCLAGGNTSEVEGNSVVGGCYNGGPQVGGESSRKFAPVPGGNRNCIRCRWFVTEPHFLPALAAHFNTLAYHFDEARNVCLAREQALKALKGQRLDAEDAGQPFLLADDLLQATRLWETAMKRFSDLAEDVVASWRLLERCKAAWDAERGDGTQLVAVGEAADVALAFEEVESELLQLAGVCEDVAVYPDLEPGKAIFRRSQLMDAVLYRDDLPPLFMLLSEQDQLLAGNAFMRHLARQMNPQNPALGRRQVIELIDAGASLSDYFGVELSAWLPQSQGPVASPAERQRRLRGHD